MTPPLLAAVLTLAGTVTAAWARRRSMTPLTIVAAALTAGLVIAAAALHPEHVWGWTLGTVVGVSLGLALSRTRRHATSGAPGARDA